MNDLFDVAFREGPTLGISSTVVLCVGVAYVGIKHLLELFKAGRELRLKDSERTSMILEKHGNQIDEPTRKTMIEALARDEFRKVTGLKDRTQVERSVLSAFEQLHAPTVTWTTLRVSRTHWLIEAGHLVAKANSSDYVRYRAGQILCALAIIITSLCLVFGMHDLFVAHDVRGATNSFSVSAEYVVLAIIAMIDAIAPYRGFLRIQQVIAKQQRSMGNSLPVE